MLRPCHGYYSFECQVDASEKPTVSYICDLCRLPMRKVGDAWKKIMINSIHAILRKEVRYVGCYYFDKYQCQCKYDDEDDTIILLRSNTETGALQTYNCNRRNQSKYLYVMARLERK